MKNYICLNHGECQWADETPPREFPLVDGELYCPNCESTNIREAAQKQHKLQRFIPLAVGAAMFIGVASFFHLKDSKSADRPGATRIEEQADTQTTAPPVDVDKKERQDEPVSPPVKTRQKPIVWTLIDNSGFCDPALDGTYFYSEQNNLGQIRERKVLNKAGCYPASN